jgi:hypothetical protein
MPVSSFELRKGIFARLDAEITTPVHSFVPQNATYPYVRIGDITSTSGDTKTEEAQEYEFTIHAFDRDAKSTETIEGILSDIYDALHEQEENITVTGFRLTLIRCEFTQIVQMGEIKDHYWHGTHIYRCNVEHV